MPGPRPRSSLASGHLDFHVRFWDSRNGDCVNDVSGIHSGQITSLNLAPSTPDRARVGGRPRSDPVSSGRSRGRQTTPSC